MPDGDKWNDDFVKEWKRAYFKHIPNQLGDALYSANDAPKALGSHKRTRLYEIIQRGHLGIPAITDLSWGT